MASENRALFAFCAVAILASFGCASVEKGDGSESHFVNCSSDSVCRSKGYDICVAGLCEHAAPGADGAPRPAIEGGQPSKRDGLPDGAGDCGPVCSDSGTASCPPGSYPSVGGTCPNECVVQNSNQPTPYAMTFRFTNPSDARVAIWQGCTYEFQLTACESGYTAPVSTFVFCTPICPDTTQVVCGQCADYPAPVSAAAPLEYHWDGYVYDDAASGPPCATQHAFPETRYRITVPVYSAMPPQLPGGGFDKTPLYSVSVDFTTSPGGVVEIPITRPH
jgi:hypothetical protein